MLLITCPHCGPRNEVEFNCGGESHLVRPGLECGDEEWAAYLFFRSNPRGLAFERWRHGHGCGRWFNVARDTVTHEIQSTYGICDTPPELDATRGPRPRAARSATQ